MIKRIRDLDPRDPRQFGFYAAIPKLQQESFTDVRVTISLQLFSFRGVVGVEGTTAAYDDESVWDHPPIGLQDKL
jgi:hypothetical protein